MKLNPRAASSNWSEQIPRSARTPSTASIPRSRTTSGSCVEAGVDERDRQSSRPRAGQLDHGGVLVEGDDLAPRSAMSRVWPPAPTVQSTTVWPGCGSSQVRTSAGRTGT